MSGITFGSGTFIRALDDGTEYKLSDRIPEITAEDIDCDGAVDKAAKALVNLGKAAAEATLTINVLVGDKHPWWRMIYGRPQRWPVSNNWLKMHGYPMRRNVQLRRAVRLVNYHHCEHCRQGDCSSFVCLPGCNYPAFHAGDCADDCEHYKKCESCWYWWNEHKGWKCPFYLWR